MSRSPRLPATWLVIGGIVSVQAGAAIAKHLFRVVSPDAMVWLRYLSSGLCFFLIARPRWRGHSRADWLTVLGFGAALVTMNWSIYHAFARIPLGVAVTIEFLGPLAVAVAGSRRLLDLLWAGLAAAGVALLGLSPARLDWVGVGLALVAATAWGGYILLSARTAKRWPGLSGLGVATLVGVLVLTGPALATSGTRLLDPVVLALGAAVGILSSVLPYSLELVALRTMPPRVFGVLMSVEPAAAALAGLVLLHETLTGVELLAMACVVVASVGATRAARPSGNASEPAPHE